MRKHIVAIVSEDDAKEKRKIYEIELLVVVLVEGIRCLGYDSIIRSLLFINFIKLWYTNLSFIRFIDKINIVDTDSPLSNWYNMLAVA